MCPIDAVPRSELLNKISTICNIPITPQLLLFGSQSLSNSDNESNMAAVYTFTDKTKRLTSLSSFFIFFIFYAPQVHHIVSLYLHICKPNICLLCTIWQAIKYVYKKKLHPPSNLSQPGCDQCL